MQGVVIDDKGVYVKAAIVKLFKTQDSEDESDSEAITYALTDDDGRFVIHYLNPDEKYAIEIHVDNSDSNAQSDEPESADETDDTDEINDQVLATEEDDVEPTTEEDEPESDDETDEAEPTDETVEAVEEIILIDSIVNSNVFESTTRKNISVNNLYFNIKPDFDLQDKPYLIKSNLW